MKIDKNRLIELLSDKTGMSGEEVNDQLQQLIDRILDAARRGKALEVKEFGMFYFDESGDLKFDPADELSTEINFKYAGMEPVELKPAREEDTAQAEETPGPEKPSAGEAAPQPQDEKEPEAEDEDEMDDIFGIPASFDEENDPIEDDMEGPDGGALISPPEKVDRESDPFSGLLGEARSKLTGEDSDKPESKAAPEEKPEKTKLKDKPEDKPEDRPEFKAEEEADDSGIGMDDIPPFVPDESETESESDPEPTSKPELKADRPPLIKTKKVAASAGSGQKRDPIMIVISVMLVLVLTAAGFFIIPTLFDGSSEETTVQTGSPAETESPVVPETAPDEAQAVLTPVEPESESEVTSSTPEAEEPVMPDQPVYGLMGEIVPEANDGYSIVLHSLRQEEAARNQAAELSSDGYRVLVGPRTVQGETVWRVSVGQFPTIPEAQEAARELPSPFNTNNFIQRIQIN